MAEPLLTFRLPDPGEGLTEAEIIRWLVAPGDQVTINQAVVEIETAKSVVELPSPFEGTVESITALEGAVVPVGDPILVVRPSESAVPEHGLVPGTNPCSGAQSAGQGVGAQNDGGDEDEAPGSVLVGYGPTGPPGASGAPESADSAGASSPERAPAREPELGTVPNCGLDDAVARPRAKPPVRALARQRGIGLDTVTPSGPGGTVTRQDVERAAAASEAPPEPAETREPIRSVRRATAAAMVESAFTAPHASVFVETDATRALKFARRTGLSLLAVTALALVRAARRNPAMNATWDQATGEIVYHHRVGLGVAVDSPRGLLVPCVHEAHRLSLTELDHALRELIETARQGKASPEQLSGGTVTLTNVGSLGIDGGSPILVPGQAAILAVGAIRPRPWVHKGKLVKRSIGRLTLTFDHRLMDGAGAAKAIRDVAAVLERPDSALI
ncbi:MAG: 2-oxo acid dehydrogenase subunit E2 [Bifidobacteriaceae bacterium]|jgi:pyruvate dehydrogenase E2 component (dihydrolipoamide acetyltransferase)|nr:2-oxo acid dehydrogenase subunit E2 [Bifidobacteriaceae bacterium]